MSPWPSLETTLLIDYDEVDTYGAIRMLLDGKDEQEESREGWKDLEGGERVMCVEAPS